VKFKKNLNGSTVISIDGNELAHAVDIYLYAMGVVSVGPRTIRVATREGHEGLCGGARSVVDPSGHVIYKGKVK
jgi:hypothetical protein